MDALDVFRVLRRRWKLTALLLAGLVLLLGAVAFAVPQQYRATSLTMVLRQYGGQDRNPFAAVDRAQGQAAVVVIAVLNSQQTRRELAAQGGTAALEVSNEGGGVSTTDSPFITVIATGVNEAAVRKTGQLAMQRIKDELKRRQDTLLVPVEQQLTLNEVLSPNEVSTTRAGQLRALGITGGIGLIIVVLTVILVDRRGNRTKPPAPEPESKPSPRKRLQDSDAEVTEHIKLAEVAEVRPQERQ
ncbi:MULTISPECIES: Wzz/FepE/Etk N-terminal domain-containing protein [unclassified Crossiella]|uniref:Wzz/FepE/Etk N-terminal domain-containing protein n=1 Tax=unclassified Crossiella TaxID=2620835 RepID=UPI001FFEB73D|nr:MULTISPECIES: Wzz/FepE/Etk N-terminal domain-containing protein [unclassified Crossiella]MCK2240821.1 Wzz/FepE/Etk N-terminal domain-containing protein [Crossiella sp. S99.2]MCK2254035.1 Wzz/FepE/Etk N-terminal domain-containing protein [Crossiella sp. S99.1]